MRKHFRFSTPGEGCDSTAPAPWWLPERLAPMRDWPGLQRAAFKLVHGDGADGYDGIAERCFESTPGAGPCRGGGSGPD